jgi:hypothetical protein
MCDRSRSRCGTATRRHMENMINSKGDLVRAALSAEYSILSSAGSHARQDWCKILARKTADIAKAKHTVWVLNSNAARPESVQSFCSDYPTRYVLFLGRQRDAEAKSGPSTADRAQVYSGGKKS